MLEIQELSTKEKLRDLLTQKKKFKGLRDLWFFNKHILGYEDILPRNSFHGELCRRVQNPNKLKHLILEPRGSLKSSLITIGYTTQQILKNPNIRILIASEEFLTATKFLSEIKGHLEKNETLLKLYGNVKYSKKGEGFVRNKWSEKEITVSTRTKWRKEPTVTCAGIDVTKVGLHYDLIIVDDPHSTKNITTREQIEKVKTWFRLLLSLLDPGGKIIIIGTRWHYDDLFGWIIDKERERKELGYKPRYHLLVKRAIAEIDDGTDASLLWPERLSREFLLDQKLEQGPYIFSCQYLNEPVDDESATFKKSWIRFYNPLSVDFESAVDRMKIFTTVDPMRDEEGNDYCGIVTCGVDKDWIAYILDVRRKKMDEYDTIEEIFDVYKRWHPQKIGVETVAWQKTYYRFVKAEMLRRGLHLPLTQLKTDTKITKRMRIKSMIPYWKSGLFKVPGTSIATLEGNFAILVDELLRYPRVSNDDCIDSLAYQDQLMKRPLISKIMRKLHPRSLNAIRARQKQRNDKSVLGVFNLR